VSVEHVNYPQQPSDSYLDRPVTPADRERVVQTLCVHFAADHLSMDSLEGRLALAYEAPSLRRLEELVSDLPQLNEQKLGAGAPARLAPPASVPDRGVVIAIMGGAARKGSWMVPRHLKVVAIMGGAEIDLRDGKFSPGVTEIDVAAFMGGVEITVPPGVRVETVGAAFMGGFEASAGDTDAVDPAAPILRVSGIAIMGGVEVRVRRPARKVLDKFEQAMLMAGHRQEEFRD
jgi:hypothetical protein